MISTRSGEATPVRHKVIFIAPSSTTLSYTAWHRKEFRELPEVSFRYISICPTTALVYAERKSVNLCLEFVYMCMHLVWSPTAARQVSQRENQRRREASARCARRNTISRWYETIFFMAEKYGVFIRNWNATRERDRKNTKCYRII